METHQTWEPWNNGKLVGQKSPLKPKDICAIRVLLNNLFGREQDPSILSRYSENPTVLQKLYPIANGVLRRWKEHEDNSA